MDYKTYAVDFDGTLCENNWPGIGEPNSYLIRNLRYAREKLGHKLILWTCREGILLVEAIVWCAQQGLFFDAVNDNLPDHKERFGGNCRKIFADAYIDDKACVPPGMPFLRKKEGISWTKTLT